MRLEYTANALADLQEIADYQRTHWPSARKPFEAQLARIEQRLLMFPQSAAELAERPGVRCVCFTRYPYRLFYQVADGTIEILHIHNTSRKPWYE